MNKYWASKDTGEVAKEIITRFDSYKDYMQKSGMITDLRKSFNTYYYRPHIQDIQQSLKAIHVNHYANLISHVLTTVTSTRPAWEPRSVNTDLASQNNTQLAAGLLDFYMREKGIEKKINKACELALFLKEGWISLNWNATGGEVYGQDETGQEIREGDVEVDVHTILDVARDVKRKDLNHIWLTVRKLKNKWDLAAKYPELAEKISSLSGNDKDSLKYELNTFNDYLKLAESEDDLIHEYSFYHDKTPALPEGRLVVLLDKDIVLFDGPLPYKKPYIFPMTGSDYIENAFGHSKMMDALPVQDSFNLCMSAILTNIAANGVQNFQVPKGGVPKVTSIKDGMNVLEYDPKIGTIEPLDLLKTAPEVYNFATMLSNEMDLLMGVPPISKGIAPATMSGTAMALLQQQAIQQSSGIQLSYTLLLENVGSALIELLQTYAVVPRIAMIAGKSKKSMMKTFTAEDLKGIGRVIVDSANPLTKTSAGRVEIANQLLQSPGMIKTPEQYIGVLTTGNLEPLYQSDNANRMLIISENEVLMDGGSVPVLLTDDDATHILEHQCVLASPEARANPQVTQAALTHIQLHLDNGRAKDPQLAAALKQVSMFQAPPPMMPDQSMQGPNVAPVMASPAVEQTSGINLPKPAQPPVLN